MKLESTKHPLSVHKSFLLLAILVILLGGYGLYVSLVLRFPHTVVNKPIPEKVAIHFCGSTPAHDTTLTTAPQEVTVCSTQDLLESSAVYITRTDTREMGFGKGKATIDSDKRLIRQVLDLPLDTEGLYTVSYSLCPTESCSAGKFQFRIVPSN